MIVPPVRVLAFGACLAASLFASPLVASAQTTEPGTAPVVAGDANRGKALFAGYGCYECHGTAGQGNFTTSPRLAPRPLPYPALLGYIRRPAGVMPSYSAAILADRDVNDIYAFLSSIGPAKPAAQIPLLAGSSLKAK